MQHDSRKLIEDLNKSSKKIRKEVSSTPKGLKSSETNKKKWTISGIIIGLVTGIPLGTFVEIWRFMTGQPWDDALIGIIILVVTLLISTVAGYFYGAYLDGGT